MVFDKSVDALEIKKKKNLSKNFTIEDKKISSFKLFLFPLLPIKIFSNINCIAMLSILMALRFVLQFTSFYVPVFSFSISVSWTPLIIIGWIYGPIFGFITGFATDTIGNLLSGSTWFWLYAIQEPMIGLISALFAFFLKVRLRKNYCNKKWFIDFFIFELIILGFSLICIYVLILQTNSDLSFEGSSKLETFFLKNAIWIISFSLLTFFIFIHIVAFIFYKKFKKNFILVIWTISLVCLLSILMSFILGPISANEYYKFMHNGNSSPYWIKLGAIFYLIPRVFKESIKAPIQIFILITVIPMANSYVSKVILNKKTKWGK